MIKRFPEVGMSALGWKVERLAVQYYPVWMQSNRQKVLRFRREVSELKGTEAILAKFGSKRNSEVIDVDDDEPQTKSRSHRKEKRQKARLAVAVWDSDVHRGKRQRLSSAPEQPSPEKVTPF